ncbi:hypothetical protein BAE44_0012299 [Dichanthelium oligosanthes]|uniref:DUF1618 domain-containing protein n=1 Tax=Dichanthelium oligosanthes TaxID=888268 RepID=A0A1E5VNN0_9POAL|nr:hypothetical protein BAE44_0012299 [Dichanthelium oligosanthes]
MMDYVVYSAAAAGAGAAPSLRLLSIEEVQARVTAEGHRDFVQVLRRMDALDTARRTSPWRSSRSTRACQRRCSVCSSTHPRPATSGLGILFCDVFAEIPELSYLELPAKIPGLRGNHHGRGWLQAYQTLGVTKGDIIKFITVIRANGLVIESYNPAQQFTITYWTLKTTAMNSMAWDKDYEVTSGQLWATDDFAHIPRSFPLYPIISMDDPNVVCFVMRQKGKVQKGDRYNYGEVQMVAIDMINLNLKSNALYTKYDENLSRDDAELYERKSWFFESFLSSELPIHLNVQHDTR